MKTEKYDCTNDVIDHKVRVGYWLSGFMAQLENRLKTHDDSKLNDPREKEMFDKWAPELKERVFGTDAYKIALDGMGEGIKLHYKANRHHPEHFEHGVNDMTLMDVVEMLCDWMAAAQARNTHVDLAHAAERFGLSEQLVKIFANTLREEDFWGHVVNHVPSPLLCPPEYRDGWIDGVTNRDDS
jgi:hypothetical protein